MGERMKARFSGIENDELAPTAPALPSDEGAPSAPPIETFQSAECVVCMERKVNILNMFCIILSFLVLSVISSSFPVAISVAAVSVTETCHSVLCVERPSNRGSRFKCIVKKHSYEYDQTTVSLFQYQSLNSCKFSYFCCQFIGTFNIELFSIFYIHIYDIF